MTDVEAIDEAATEYRRLQLWLIAIMFTLVFTIFVQWRLSLEHQEIKREINVAVDLKNGALKSELAALQMEIGRYLEIQNGNLAYTVTLHIKMAEHGIDVPEIPSE